VSRFLASALLLQAIASSLNPTLLLRFSKGKKIQTSTLYAKRAMMQATRFAATKINDLFERVILLFETNLFIHSI
jgi:hypothetical protein